MDQHRMQVSQRPRVLIWDLPTRLFHWLLVAAFAVAWVSAEEEAWAEVHAAAGMLALGLVGFRLLWGVVGSRHARFASFVRGPRAALDDLRAVMIGPPRHHAGHNPAGGLVIVAMLAATALSAATGWAGHGQEESLAGEVHEGLTGLLLTLVGVHLAGVLVGSWVHRENLVRAMFTGMKCAAPDEGLPRAYTWAAPVLLAWLGVVMWWWL